MSKPVPIYSPSDFVHSFLNALATGLLGNDLPLQIYPLQYLLPHLKTPTPLHRTTFNYLVVQLDGNAVQQVDTEVLPLQAHDVLLIRQGQIISIQSVDPAAKGFFILFDNEALVFLKGKETQRILEANPHFRLSPKDSHWVQQLCQLMLSSSSSSSKLDISLHLFAALLHTLTVYCQPDTPSLDRMQEVAHRFKRLAFAKAIEEKAIPYYAAQLHVSDNYLNRCVKTTTGKTPKEWILEICLLQSKILLQDTFTDIAEVAFQAGFTDPSYFGRLFKKKFGQTPTDYRATYGQDLSEHRPDFS